MLGERSNLALTLVELWIAAIYKSTMQHNILRVFNCTSKNGIINMKPWQYNLFYRIFRVLDDPLYIFKNQIKIRYIQNILQKTIH